VRRFSVIFLVLVALGSNIADACSPSPGWVQLNWPPEPENLDVSERPQAPKVRLGNIYRGYDDGFPGSCSDFGMLEIVVAEDAPVAYEFEVVGGALPEELFPDVPVTPFVGNEGILKFHWVEGYAGEVSRIEATVEVRQVYANGFRSNPETLKLEHPGDEGS